jgi:uncharacterized protein YjbI with pentapeptide repeats
MISADVKMLRERWRSPEGRALGLAVARWLAGKGWRPPRGVGRHEGRVDLRGFAFPDARQVGPIKVGRSTFQSIEGMPQFAEVRWREIDFTGAVIRHARFFSSVIEDCRFDEADLFDWRLWDAKITDCSFVKADLRNSAIGTGTTDENGENVWTRVNFDRADLVDATVVGCVFRQCTFRKAKIRKVWFSYVTFEDVVFEGLLESVLFEARQFENKRDPGPMRDVDFRGVVFRRCEIQYRFDTVLFDESPDVRVFRDYPMVIKRASELARESSNPEEQALFPTLEEMADEKSIGSFDSVFFPADFISSGLGEVGGVFGRLLERAEADLASERA